MPILLFKFMFMFMFVLMDEAGCMVYRVTGKKRCELLKMITMNMNDPSWVTKKRGCAVNDDDDDAVVCSIEGCLPHPLSPYIPTSIEERE